MNKHMESHNEETKFCHYYNNGKICPYEEIGCKFKHKESTDCRFDRSCRFALCQFKHTKQGDGKEDGLNNDAQEKDKYDILEEYNKDEIKEEICCRFCWQGYHKCYEKLDENELIGIDVIRIKEDFKNCVEEEMFYCEACKFQNKDMTKVQDHFLSNQIERFALNCLECGKKFKTVKEFKRHMGNHHYVPKED